MVDTDYFICSVILETCHFTLWCTFSCFAKFKIKTSWRGFTDTTKYISYQTPIITFIPLLSHKPYLGLFKHLWWIFLQGPKYAFVSIRYFYINCSGILENIKIKCHRIKYARILIFTDPYFSVTGTLNGKMRVSENSYSRIFYRMVFWYEMSYLT